MANKYDALADKLAALFTSENEFTKLKRPVKAHCDYCGATYARRYSTLVAGSNCCSDECYTAWLEALKRDTEQLLAEMAAARLASR